MLNTKRRVSPNSLSLNVINVWTTVSSAKKLKLETGGEMPGCMDKI